MKPKEKYILASVVILALFSVTLVLPAAQSSATVNQAILNITASVLQPKAEDPVDVLVIDWMSDPTLDYLNTLLNENFETVSIGMVPVGWSSEDNQDAGGDDFWLETDYRAHSGVRSVWCAQYGDKQTPNSVSHTYDNNMDAESIFYQSLASYSSATLSFWYWLDAEPNKDWLSVEARGSSLSPWTVIANFTGSSGWQSTSISLDSFCGLAGTDFQVRFRFWSDSTNYYEGAYIDDVKITAYDTLGTQHSIDENFENVGIGTVPSGWTSADWNVVDDLDCWGVTNYRAHSGSKSMWCAQVGDKKVSNSVSHVYDDNMDSELKFTTGLIGRSSATLSFWYWLDAEPNKDWLSVEARGSSLSPWTVIANYTGNSGGWKYASLSLDDFCGELVPEIRFRFWSDRANSNYEGAYIDDVMITASAYPVLDNSRELIFWTAINSSPDFNVVIKPPRILDYEASVSSILQGGGLVTQTGIQQYIQQIRPDVIVLDDLYLDMFGVWGFNETERLAIFDYN